MAITLLAHFLDFGQGGGVLIGADDCFAVAFGSIEGALAHDVETIVRSVENAAIIFVVIGVALVVPSQLPLSLHNLHRVRALGCL